MGRLISYAENVPEKVLLIGQIASREGVISVKHGNRSRARAASNILTRLVEHFASTFIVDYDPIIRFITTVLHDNVCKMRWIEGLLMALIVSEAGSGLTGIVVPELVRCATLQPQTQYGLSLRRIGLVRAMGLRCLACCIPALSADLTLQEHTPIIARVVIQGLGQGQAEPSTLSSPDSTLQFPDEVTRDISVAASLIVVFFDVSGSLAVVKKLALDLLQSATEAPTQPTIVGKVNSVTQQDSLLLTGPVTASLLALRLLAYFANEQTRFHLAAALSNLALGAGRPDLLVHFISAATLPCPAALDSAFRSLISGTARIATKIHDTWPHNSIDEVTQVLSDGYGDPELPLPAVLLAVRELLDASHLPQCRAAVALTLLNLCHNLSQKTSFLVHVFKIIAQVGLSACPANSPAFLVETCFTSIPLRVGLELAGHTVAESLAYPTWVCQLLVSLLRSLSSYAPPGTSSHTHFSLSAADLSPLHLMLRISRSTLEAEVPFTNDQVELLRQPSFGGFRSTTSAQLQISTHALISACVFLLFSSNSRHLSRVLATLPSWPLAPVYPSSTLLPVTVLRAAVQSALAPRHTERPPEPPLPESPLKLPIGAIPPDIALLLRLQELRTPNHQAHRFWQEKQQAHAGYEPVESDSETDEHQPSSRPIPQDHMACFVPESSDASEHTARPQDLAWPCVFPQALLDSVSCSIPTDALVSVFQCVLDIVHSQARYAAAGRCHNLAPAFHAVYSAVLLAISCGYRGFACVVPLLLAVHQCGDDWHEFILSAFSWLTELLTVVPSGPSSPCSHWSQSLTENELLGRGSFGVLLVQSVSYPLTEIALEAALRCAVPALPRQSLAFVQHFAPRVVPAAVSLGLISVPIVLSKSVSPVSTQSIRAPSEGEGVPSDSEGVAPTSLRRCLRGALFDSLSELRPGEFLGAVAAAPELLLI